MFKKIMSLSFALTVFGGVLMFGPSAMAAEPKKIGQYGDWVSYVLIENGKKVCYMVSQPTKDQGNYSRRGDIFALVTHRPGENTTDVFSYIAGYNYKPGSDAKIKVNSKSYVLFTQDDTAWAPDASADKKISEAIRSGSKMVVTGTSSRGTLTTDTYSLKGSSAAYKAISRECGVR